MPITFDTLDELKAFYRTFRLDEDGKGSRGRRSAAPGLRVRGEKGLKRGPKRGSQGRASAVVKVKKAPVDKTATLTFKIRAAIQSFLDAGRSFTANDVYDELVRRGYTVNKQSVITSVLKQMNSTFKTIRVTERAGNGPRKVKLYNP